MFSPRKQARRRFAGVSGCVAWRWEFKFEFKIFQNKIKIIQKIQIKIKTKIKIIKNKTKEKPARGCPARKANIEKATPLFPMAMLGIAPQNHEKYQNTFNI